MNPAVRVSVDLDRVRTRAREVVERCGVDVLAVLKADAYGLGAAGVARALVGVVQGFYFYSLDEVRTLRQVVAFDTPALVLRGDLNDVHDFLEARATPIVWDQADAKRLRAACPVVSVDTGQQRFACHPDALDDILRAGAVTQVMTHATRPDQVARFDELTRRAEMTLGGCLRRHAAGSGLLDTPAAWFDAVRPGLALYHDAMTVTTNLIDVRASVGPTGYSGFTSSTGRHGIIPCGYTDGLRAGSCVINGHARLVREVGMQSAFVETGPHDRVGDPVTLLGPGVSVSELANHWGTSAQEVLVSLSRAGRRIAP